MMVVRAFRSKRLRSLPAIVGRRARSDGKSAMRWSAVAAMSCVLAGCNWVGSLGGPERIAPVAEEVGHAREYVNSIAASAFASTGDKMAARNDIISTRMYVIDMEYTQYEAQLMREGQLVDFSTKLSAGVLTTVSGLVPAIGTSHTLAETATLINGLDSAYNDKVLKSQIIQNVLASMRTARHDQAAVLYANMYCPTTVYPIGFALSDLEAYYRAGTFQTGLIKLMQTVSKAESDAKANQDNNKPAPNADAKAKLKANATEAKSKAEAPTPSQTVAATGAVSQACKAPGLSEFGYLPKQGGALAKSTTSDPAQTNMAGQGARNHL